MTMENRGHIVACDVHDKRLAACVHRLRRAGVHNVEQHLIATGDKWAKRQAGKFDRVLVDAPCTGCGTWRRNPDARLRLTETDLAELVEKQAAILDTASRLVRPGGRLIYATCSLLPAENEAQIAAFTQRHPDFAVTPAREAWPSAPKKELGQGPYLSLTPLQHDTDGFFGAVLTRAMPAAPAAPEQAAA
jgi:16S rRNA (cytosine967-C5)-methyltransferase